ncbi:MAG: hypothetical protein AB7N80_11685 [Bdellovibrionales bacterium]
MNTKVFLATLLGFISTFAVATESKTINCEGMYYDYGFQEEVKAGALIESEEAEIWFESGSISSPRFKKTPVLANSKYTEMASTQSQLTLRLDTQGLNATSGKRIRGTVSYTGYFSGETIGLSCDVKN